MQHPVYLGLINNAALLLSLGLLYELIGFRIKDSNAFSRQLLTGSILGGIGIAIMLNPWSFGQGIVFDTRSVLLGITGLFFGTIPVLLAVLLTGIFRVFLGGDGVVVGVAVIVTSGAIGLAWRHLRLHKGKTPSFGELFLLGSVVHLAMLACMFLLPLDTAVDVLKHISAPVLLIYPISTAILGKLMEHRRANQLAALDLKQSEEKFRNIFQHHAAAKLLIDPETGKIVEANPAAAQLYGWPVDTLRRMNIKDINTLSLEEVAAEMAKAKTGSRIYFDFQHRTASGTCMDVEVYSSNISIDGRNYLHSIIHDVTKRKEAERQLDERQRFLGSVLKTTADGFLVIDTEGIVTEVNDAYCAMSGFSLDDLIGKHIGQLDATESENDTNQRIEQIKQLGTLLFESFHHHANKGTFPVEISVSYVDVQDGNGSFVCFCRDLTDRKLQESKLRSFGEMLDTAPVGVLLHESDGTLLYANQAACSMHGYDNRTAFLKKNLKDSLASEMRETFSHRIKMISETNELRFESTHIHKDGRQFPVETVVKLIDWAGQQTYLAVNIDISERRRAQEAVASSNELLRYIIEHANSAIAVHDRELRYVYVSSNYLKQYNIKESEIIGKHHYEVFPDLPQKWRDVHQKALQGKISSSERDSYPRGDGSFEWTRWSCLPWYESDGSIGGFIVYTEVITDRVRSEEALREREEYLRAMIACSPVALYTIDMDGKVINWNKSAERIFGWRTEEIIGKPLPIVPKNSEEEFEALRRQVIEKQGFFGNELKRLKKDGTIFPVSLSVAAIRNDKGDLIGILGAAEDLTEQKAFESQLEWNLRRNELLSQIAVELMRNDEPQALVENICRQVMEFIDCQAFFNFLENDQQGKLHLNAYAGIPEEEAQKIEWLEYGVAICGCVAQNRQPLFCEHILSRDDDPLTDLVKSYDIQAYCCHPLMIKNRLIGTLSFGRRSTPSFDQKEIDFMASVANLVAIALNRFETEHKLRDSESRFRMFAELAPLGIVISDEQENTLYANPRFTELFGYTKEDMPSVQQWWELAYPVETMRNSVKEEWRTTIEQAKCLSSKISPREYPVTCKDGTIRHIEFRVAATGQLNVVVFTDITERKQVEATKEEFVRIFQDSLNEVYVFDAHTLLIIQANQAALNNSGYSLEELRSMSPLDLKPDFKSEKFHRLLNTLRDEEKAKVVFEATHQRKDGSHYHVEVHLQLHKFRAHERFVAIILDITERKKAEEETKSLGSQLQQAQKMESIGRLAGGVAHDYNNMLGVILGYTEMALDKLYHDDPLYNDLTEIQKAAERSADITRQLLAFSRQQTIAPKVLDLNQVVTNLKGMLRRLIGEDIELRWHLGEDLWPIYMDPIQFDQILMNLCVNARDAIADVGTIAIETNKATLDDQYCLNHYGFVPGDFTVLSVTDNGSGMDRETRDKLFEPFFTTKARGKGTGLGLATVYGILRQNNCFINVYSEPGQGTRFTIYFPRHHEEQSSLEKTPATAHMNQRGHETILLLEDEEAILTMTTLMLKGLGYNVLPCNSPNEALEAATQRDCHIHLLITDVVMPEMNGRELSKRLKQQYPELKTLFMSGYTANVIAHRGVLDKEVNFIQKPFSTNKLARKIREVLES